MTQSVYLTTRLVRSAEELFAIERMAVQGFGSRKINEAVLSSSTDTVDHIVLLTDTTQSTSLTRIRHSMALPTDTANGT